jgi:hypothetical protein
MFQILTTVLLALLLSTGVAPAGVIWQFHVTDIAPSPDMPEDRDLGLLPPALGLGPTMLILELPPEGGRFGGPGGACFGPRGELEPLPDRGYCDPRAPDDLWPVVLEYDLRPDGAGGWLGHVFADFFQGDNAFNIARETVEDGWTGWWGYDDLANTCSFGPSYCPIEGFWQRVSATPYSVPGPAPLSLLVVGLAALGLVRTRQRSR